MRYLIIILLISSLGHSQTKCNLKNTTTFEKVLYTELAVVGYATADYIGYNLLKGKNEGYWRFCQGVLFATINYILHKYVSPGSAVSFSIACITGTPDLIYYGYDKAIGKQTGLSNGNEFSVGGSYSHLTFLPTVWGGDKATGVDLITNVILGTAFSIVIQF